MDTSTTDNSEAAPTTSVQAAALADGLTLVRLLLGPLVAVIIIFGLRFMDTGEGNPDLPYRDFGFAVLASVLFALGALTDLLDDILGGAQKAGGRMFGWFDDAADAVLIGAALLALIYTSQKAGVLSPALLILAATYIGRDVLVGIFKGFDFSKTGVPYSKLGDYKNGLAMLGTGLLIATPWLGTVFERVRAETTDNIAQAWMTSGSIVWNLGLICLGIATVLSLITAYDYFKGTPVKADEADA